MHAYTGDRYDDHKIACATSASRSARLPVNLIGSPINYANLLIVSPITSQSTAREGKAVRGFGVRTPREGERGVIQPMFEASMLFSRGRQEMATVPPRV